MNIWIITTGSSDVQLKNEKNWNPLHSKVRNQLETQKQFSSSKSQDGKRSLYPARVMGIVYGTAIENDLKHYEDLDFPLLNNFFWILEGKDGKTDRIVIDRVIVLVTNQSEKFKVSEKNNPFSAFWQDTYTLQPILKEYFKRKSIENPEFLVLDPDPKKSSGLDNWNDILERVQEKFKEKFANLKDISEDTTIYVSHQAGTPAISSAVQFCSLAKFGDRVKFLVSNEQDATLTDIVKSSAYLRGIEIQQAKKLLNRYDYAGLMTLLKPYLNPKNSKDKRVRSLLKAAIQWNLAKFGHFKRLLMPLGIAQEKDFPWYWFAYEDAYLAVIRLEQKDVVEALFHSFRSFEGLAIQYAKRNGVRKHGRQVFRYLKSQNQLQWNNHPYIQNLIDLENNDPQTRDDVIERRNNLFHNLVGLNQASFFDAWKATEATWQSRVLGCLNFISGESFSSFDPEAMDEKPASLMVKVHQELEKAIAHL